MSTATQNQGLNDGALISAIRSGNQDSMDRGRTVEKVRAALKEMPAPQRSALEMA